MYIKFPYQIDTRGRTALTNREDHIRDLIKQVLFTAPGERVNRPNFGSGLHQLVFNPNSEEIASTVQFLVKGALQQWLSDWIEVGEVKVTVQEATLTVQVEYTESGSPIIKEATFNRTL